MKSYEYKEQRYYWSGKSWLDEHYVAVCGELSLELTKRFQVRIEGVESAAALRKEARAQGLVSFNQLAERTLLESKDPAALASLVGHLRDRGQQKRALILTRKGPMTPALLVARAACWCDLGYYEKARAAAGLARMMGSGMYADAVLRRISREAS